MTIHTTVASVKKTNINRLVDLALEVELLLSSLLKSIQPKFLIDRELEK